METMLFLHIFLSLLPLFAITAASTSAVVCFVCQYKLCKLNVPEYTNICNTTYPTTTYTLSYGYGTTKCYYYDENNVFNTVNTASLILSIDIWAPVMVSTNDWRWLSLIPFTYVMRANSTNVYQFTYNAKCTLPRVCVNGNNEAFNLIEQSACFVYDYNINVNPRPIRLPLENIMAQSNQVSAVGIVCNSDGTESILPIRTLKLIGLFMCPPEIEYDCQRAACETFNFSLTADFVNARRLEKNEYAVVDPEDIMCCDTDVGMAGYLLKIDNHPTICLYFINNQVSAVRMKGVRSMKIDDYRIKALEIILKNVYFHMYEEPFVLKTLNSIYYVGIEFIPGVTLKYADQSIIYQLVETEVSTQFILNSDGKCFARPSNVIGQRIINFININVSLTRKFASDFYTLSSSMRGALIWKPLLPLLIFVLLSFLR